MADAASDSGSGTIACVAGFLFNLVERSVKLISPCSASARWPLGYIVHAEGSFRTLRDLRSLLAGMIDDHMPVDVVGASTLRFHPGVNYRRGQDGFRLWSSAGGLRLTDRNGRAAYFGELGDLVSAGRHSAREVAGHLLERHGVLPGESFRILQRIFDRGYLCEEPDGSGVALGDLVQISPSAASQGSG